MADAGGTYRRCFICNRRPRRRVAGANNLNNENAGSGSRQAERRPLGDELFVTHQLVAVLLVGSAPVLVPEDVQAGLQCVQDGVVLVHGQSCVDLPKA